MKSTTLVVLKKIVDRNFQETVQSIWKNVKQLGLTEEDVNASLKKRKLKVVLDTNVWVSALIWGGLPT